MLSLAFLSIRVYLRSDRPKGQKIGKLWYVSKENLKGFLDGGKQEGNNNIEFTLMRYLFKKTGALKSKYGRFFLA